MKDELQRSIVAGEIQVDDADLDREPILLADGTVLDEAAAGFYAERAATAAATTRGRPSLTGSGKRSPQIAVRLPAELHARLVRQAADEGRRLSDVVRDAVESYVS